MLLLSNFEEAGPGFSDETAVMPVILFRAFSLLCNDIVMDGNDTTTRVWSALKLSRSIKNGIRRVECILALSQINFLDVCAELVCRNYACGKLVAHPCCCLYGQEQR